MKHILKVLLVSMALIAASNLMYSQTTTTVLNKRAGKLSKAIKKKDVLKITMLKITGEMNSDDFAYLTEFKNLEYLDFKDVKLTTAYEKQRQYVTSESTLKLPILNKVEKLHLPISCTYISRLNNVSNLKALSLSDICNFDDKDSIHLQQIFVAKSNSTSSRYNSNYDHYGFYANETPNSKNTPEIQTHKLTVDTLILAEENFLQVWCKPLKYITPYLIIINDNKKKYLNRWSDHFDLQSIKDINGIAPAAFAGSNIATITISPHVKRIPDYCFFDCKNLKEINLTSVEYIGNYAFSNTAIKSMVIPASLKRMSYAAFSNSSMQRIEFLSPYPPTLENVKSYFATSWERMDIIIPQNSYSTFRIGKWKEIPFSEKGEKTHFIFNVKEPGTLHSYISNEQMERGDSLTIIGHLYDTDFETIKLCKKIRFIDLSQAHITISPKTAQEKKEKDEALLKLLSGVSKLAAQESAKKYKEGKTNLKGHLQTGITAEAIDIVAQEALEKSKQSSIQVETKCILPNYSLKNMFFLQEVKLPQHLSEIKEGAFISCRNLQKIVLPSNLKIIESYTFSNCVSLNNINFPSNLETIGKYAFNKCIALEIVDLSNTKIQTIEEGTFSDCTSATIFKAPATLITLKSYPISQTGRCKYYFKSMEPPIGFRATDSDIYIPKGSQAGWQTRSRLNVLIEE